MKEVKEFIRNHSIDNLRVGKIISKTASRYVVRVGTTEIICYFSGEAAVGDIVTLECPDGIDNKGYILGKAPVGLAEGENVVI